ncbi:MAG: DPP IV N-terminal domain-containing protein [Prevotella sp.]|nr:DPP IV N-terminal domain-containing protein [Prevotella sp.]
MSNNRLWTHCVASILLLTAIALPMSAQKLFTLEDLNFGGTNYHNLRPKNMFLTWWGNQLVRTDVEECNLIDAKTGKETPLFTLDDVNKWAGSDDDHYVRHLTNATFPYPDKPLVLLGFKKSMILLDFKKHQIVWQDSISEQQCNEWNAASKATVYKADHQLYVVDAQGNKQQLTTDGSREIVYGEAVHRNEFGITKGTFWSPDGMRLAFYRMDQSMVSDYPQVNIDPRVAEQEPDKYPMAGMTSHEVTIGIYDLRTHKTTFLRTPSVGCGFPADTLPCYFTNIAWSPDSKTIYMFELNRDQNDCRLISYDAETGKRLQELYRETSDKYVEPQHPIVFLPWDSNLFIMQSQRDGFNHLYLYNIRGELVKQLTNGPWVVMDVLGFNKKDKSIVIASNEKHPLQRNLYAVSINTLKRMPLDNGEGVHRGVLSTTGNLLYDKWTTPTTPNTINLTATAAKPSSGSVRADGFPPSVATVTLLKAEDPWKDYIVPQFESGSIKAADGTTDLYWRMVKPHDFDPAKKYPTVVYVYGGPHAHNVEASWHWYSRSWETYMAQKGYIVFILDNRGSENRGRDFEQATFRQLGQIEMQDQMKGVEFLKSLPYVDMNRLGVHGWSFGGFMTISLMTNYPDVFKVGVAGGPVIDWQWYEVMYGERYMDTPETNPEGYKKTSLVSKAGNLKGKLQIIIGYNDPTVVPQHALSFLKACNEAGTQPDFYVYPGEGHNMKGHASVHLHERITQYFEDYLK